MNSLELAVNVRKDAVTMVHEHHASHIGSALSIVDMLAVLYADILHIDPKKSKMGTTRSHDVKKHIEIFFNN